MSLIQFVSGRRWSDVTRTPPGVSCAHQLVVFVVDVTRVGYDHHDHARRYCAHGGECHCLNCFMCASMNSAQAQAFSVDFENAAIGHPCRAHRRGHVYFPKRARSDTRSAGPSEVRQIRRTFCAQKPIANVKAGKARGSRWIRWRGSRTRPTRTRSQGRRNGCAL